MAENYSRRLNVRVVGLAEGTERGQPVEFFESWLPCVLKMPTKAGRIKLERAHRSLAPKPDPNRRPRSLLLRFHAFRDKQRVMEAAHQASQDGGLTYDGSKISFYSDFSLMKKRKGYNAVKQRLRERGMPYARGFPPWRRYALSLNLCLDDNFADSHSSSTQVGRSCSFF